MAVIDKVSSMQASKSDARGDPEPMDVDDQGNKMVQSTASAKTLEDGDGPELVIGKDVEN